MNAGDSSNRGLGGTYVYAAPVTPDWAETPAAPTPPGLIPDPAFPGLGGPDRVTALEREVGELRRALADLREHAEIKQEIAAVRAAMTALLAGRTTSTPPAVTERCCDCGRGRTDGAETGWAVGRDGKLWCPGCVARHGGLDNLPTGGSGPRAQATLMTQREKDQAFAIAGFLRGLAVRVERDEVSVDLTDAKQLRVAAELLRRLVLGEVAP